ncbi:putative transcription factor C3H family [Helianthus annuus]|uniref:Putative zinc finger, CCCH-type n=1 Tax=Helianthus annuus TaxID=4232 RepID=A0A251RW95_HELAN|nr:mRNA decay factor CTH2 [Helianthus annuus]KAF5758164.1 putative transcription factor C3H family [Helianthus annuus]
MFPKRPRFSQPSPNHKTELCSQFQRGSCGYGDRCCFAHDIQELKGFQKPQQVIAVDEDKKVVSNSNPRLCWRFMNGEKCQYGDKCHFIHVRDEGTNVLLWRTKLCKRWMENGRCKYGRNCCFAHGESELQNQGLNDYVEAGLFKMADKNMEGNGKRLKVKWKSNEKISRVYADWINDMPLVSHTI